MNQQPAKGLPKGVPELSALGSTCARCWAAGYCAVFSPASPTPPPTCPLLPSIPTPTPKDIRD
ncbi:MAG: hypothetical protein ACRYG7_09870 [Janthinobacterium lividum]